LYSAKRVANIHELIVVIIIIIHYMKTRVFCRILKIVGALLWRLTDKHTHARTNLPPKYPYNGVVTFTL